MKISCTFVAEVRQHAGTGHIDVILEGRLGRILVEEALVAVESAFVGKNFWLLSESENGELREIRKNLLVFLRGESGGLKRVFDPRQSFDPQKEELVLSSLMLGG